MSKKLYKKLLILCYIILVGFFLSSVVVYAEGSTSVSLTYPDFTNANSPGDFVNRLFLYALGISGTLAVLMIIYGGIKYIASAGNVSKQSDSIDIIKNAVYGILLLGGAALILNTINPKITKLQSLDISPIPAISNTGNGDGNDAHECPEGYYWTPTGCAPEL